MPASGQQSKHLVLTEAFDPRIAAKTVIRLIHLGYSTMESSLNSHDVLAVWHRRDGQRPFLVLRFLVPEEAYANLPRFAIGSSYVGRDLLNRGHCRNFPQHINDIYGLTQEDQN